MIFDELRRGFMIGLAVSIPVGPIALLIMRRSILDGRLAGFVSGLGAATADLLCGMITAISLAGITLLIEHHESLLRLVGGLFLLGMGIHALRTPPPTETRRPVHERNLLMAYVSTGLLTIANPLTLMGMTFVSAAAGVGAGHLSTPNTVALASGISAGSASWWLLLSSSSEWLGRKLGSKTLYVVNLIAGWSIIIFGVVQITQLISGYLH